MKKIFNLAFLLLSVVACNGGGGSGGGSSTGSVLEVHKGYWLGCEDDANNNESASYQIFLDDNQATEEVTFFSGLGCNSGSEGYNLRTIYTYTRSGNNYNFTVVSITSTSLSNADVTNSNNISYCGYTDWSLGIPKNIAGRNCGGATISLGDSTTSTFQRSGTVGTLTNDNGTTTLNLQMEGSLANLGQTLSDGNYAFYDGSSGVFFTVSGANYSTTYFDAASKLYYEETGTFTSANNQATFTLATAPCSGAPGDSFLNSFRSFQNALLIRDSSETSTIMMEKVSFNRAQFISSYLEAGYAVGCF